MSEQMARQMSELIPLIALLEVDEQPPNTLGFP